MLMRYILISLALAVVLPFTGCKTPDYSARAVETAREYALENLKGLNENQRHFIRFTLPELYSDLIFEQRVVPQTDVGHIKFLKPSHFPVDPDQDIMHHCFVWAPPGLNAKVVVVGDGERSLRCWSPFRVILKNFIPADVDYTAARKAAVEYAISTMPKLPQTEINRLRFSEPEVLYTRFPLELKYAVTEDENMTPLESYLADERAKAESEFILTQLSLVWRADEADTVLVVSGFSRFGCLNQWQPHTIRYINSNDLKNNTLSANEVGAIEKVFSTDPKRQVHTLERKAERGNTGKETGSIFGGDLAF